MASTKVYREGMDWNNQDFGRRAEISDSISTVNGCTINIEKAAFQRFVN